MVDIRQVVACPETGSFWEEGREPAACDDPAHEHPRFELHRHRTLVVLPGGAEVTAVSFDPDAYTRPQAPDFGLYLDAQWQPPWPHAHLDWPDFGVPDDPAPVLGALGSLLDRARAGEHVEIGCVGAHGRTGTALAALAVLSGVPPADAVGWVRANYCDKAVETPGQEAFVAGLDG
jgi:hypothetical protein